MKTKSTIKHILAIVLSLLMVFSVAIPAFAAGTYTITINNAEGLADMKNGQFTAYQIFGGTFIDDDTMTNISWATGVNSSDLMKALASSSIASDFAGVTNANPTQVAEVLESKATDDVFLQAFAKVAKNYLGTGANSTKVTADKSTISVSNAGYYLVVQNSDIKDKNGKNGVRSSFILEVINKDTDVYLKADIPSVTKDVSDRNAGFGDYVQFTLTATLPNNFSDYDKYYLRFNDTLSDGLQLAIDSEHKLVVTVAGTAITKFVTNAANGNTGSFYVSIRNLKDAAFANTGVTNGSKIIVTYWAMVNTSAKITETNIVDLSYSNDPNNTGIPYDAPDYPDPEDPDYPDDPNYPGDPDPEDPDNPPGPGTGTTVEDIEHVHNYTVNVTKMATDGKKLDGAKFYLLNEAGKYATVADGKITGWVDAEKDATALVSKNGGIISIIGLDAATYTLREFAAPSDDYGIINDDITFTISATLSEDGSTVESVSTVIGDGTPRVDAKVVSSNAGTHTIALELTDPTNTNLPSTGGIGTTIFYVVGGMMVLAAVAYLVISKKKAKAQ